MPLILTMKKLYWILSTVAVVLLLWLGWRRIAVPHVDTPSKTVWKTDAPTSIQNDPVKIFQRAFWASPTSEDKILHAERREWSGADGVEKWQWFLVVEPSPALLKRLRDDNAFGLIPAPSVTDIDHAPNWFQFKREEVSVLKSQQAKLQLIFDKKGQTLYATDSGLGFRPGAPEQFKPAPQAPVPGRLPTTPPPRPQP